MEVYSVKDTEHGISLSFFSQKFTEGIQKVYSWNVCGP